MYTFSIEEDPGDEDGYVFGGFQQPVNADGSSVFKSGRIIPVKIIIRNGNGQSIPTATVTISVYKITDAIQGTKEEVLGDSSGNANSDNLFRYDDLSGQYIFNLSTKGSSKGTYQVDAEADNGEIYSVGFSLK
jgi:hypothetical protein